MPDSTPSRPELSPFDRRLLAERMRLRKHDQALLSAAHIRADVKPHQWEAVQQALQGIPPRVLLADDGDLGRRTQAMALLKELELRGQANRVLVIAPINEDKKWVRTMHQDFGIDMERGDHVWSEGRRQSKEASTNLGNRPQQRIVMPQGLLTPGRQGRDLVSQPWDVVIVEDALDLLHGYDMEEENRAARGAEAVRNATARIFCCEQPHRAGHDAFWKLIELLDPLSVSSDRSQHDLTHRMVRRCPATVAGVDMGPPDGTYNLVEVELSEAEQAFYEAATAYIHDIYPVLAEGHNYNARGFTQGMTYLLMEHPVAFAYALQQRADSIEFVADLSLSETASALLAGQERPTETSEEERTQAREELSAAAEAHPDVMLEDELNRIIDFVEEAWAFQHHTKTVAARNIIDGIISETPDVPIVVVARHPDTMHAVEEAFADASWHDRVVVHDTFHDEDACAKTQSALDARTSPVLITWEGALTLGYIQAQASHVVNFDTSWYPTSTRRLMAEMARLMNEPDELTWYDLHTPGTREGRIIASMHERVHPLYGQVKARSTIDGVFDSLYAKPTVMHTVRNDVPLREALRALEADLDARIEELRSWQEADFFTCTSFDADDKDQIEARVAASQQLYGTSDERASLVAALIEHDGGTWTSHSDGTYTIALSPEDEGMRYAFDPDIARTEDVPYLSPGHPLMKTATERVLKSSVLSASVGQKQVPFLGKPGITFVYRLEFENGRGEVIRETLYPLHVPVGDSEPSSEQGERVLEAEAVARADHSDVRSLRLQRMSLQARAEAALSEHIRMIEAECSRARQTQATSITDRLHRVQDSGGPVSDMRAVQQGRRRAAIDAHSTVNARLPVLVGWCYAVPA